jgi:translation initiation factor 2 beta subunit (eIF-2beta)/eIF-5
MSSTNKPILVIMDGENEENIEKYLRSFKRFHICKNDQKSIEKAINEILYNKSNSIKNATPRELMATNIIEKILK